MAFNTRKEAQEAGWFSRRHESRDAHDEARARHGTLTERRARRQASAQARADVRALIHPLAQLAFIETRPGNSAREKARILAQIEKG